MDVGSRMTTPVCTIEAGESMQVAIDVLKRSNVRQLPVVEEGRLVGILTDRDLRRHCASGATALEIHELHYLLDRIKVRDIMTPDPVTISPSSSITEAAALLRTHTCGALPVAEQQRVVGIITVSDILDIFIEVLSGRLMGSRVEMVLEDRPGCSSEVRRVIEQRGVEILSIKSSSVRDDKRVLIVDVVTLEYEELVRDLDAAGVQVLSTML